MKSQLTLIPIAATDLRSAMYVWNFPFRSGWTFENLSLCSMFVILQNGIGRGYVWFHPVSHDAPRAFQIHFLTPPTGPRVVTTKAFRDLLAEKIKSSGGISMIAYPESQRHAQLLPYLGFEKAGPFFIMSLE